MIPAFSFTVEPLPTVRPQETTEELVAEQDLHDLVLFNDDVNSFDHVIACLVDLCGHSEEQAEQCALITHFKGKSRIKRGTWEALAPVRNALCQRGLSAEVL